MARAGALSSIVATLLLTVWALVALPDRVPVHFGLDGTPDRWGSRGELLVLAGVVVVLVVGCPGRSRDRRHLVPRPGQHAVQGSLAAGP